MQKIKLVVKKIQMWYIDKNFTNRQAMKDKFLDVYRVVFDEFAHYLWLGTDGCPRCITTRAMLFAVITSVLGVEITISSLAIAALLLSNNDKKTTEAL